MKKAAVMLMIMTVITSAVFFCPVVHAYDLQVANKKIEHYQTGSLYVTTTAVQFYPVTYDSSAPSQWYGGAETETMITLRLYNSSSQDCYLGNALITLTFANTGIVPYTSGIENYGNDLYLSFDNNSSDLKVVPSADYSLWTGIVIPPGASLYLCASVFTQCVDTTVRPDAVALTNVQCSVSGVSYGDFDYPGDPVPSDLSGIESSLQSIDGNTDNVEQLIQDIKDMLEFTGSTGTVGYNPTQAFVRSATSTSLPYMYTSYSIYTGNSYVEDDEVAIADHDSAYHNYTRVVPITISIQMENYYEYAVANVAGTDLNALAFIDLLPNDQWISYTVESCESGVFQNPRIIYPGSNGYASLIFDYKIGSQPSGGGSLRGVCPIGLNYSTFVIFAHIRGNNVFALNGSFTNPAADFVLTDLHINADNRVTTGEIWSILQRPSQEVQDNSAAVNNDADQVAQQMQDVHQQEMQYFEDNQDAIAATGLNNFQFNQNHISAFTMITTQFTELWNALSDYTLVFIFTLLLSLATYIIKHEPTTKVKQYRSSVAAERAERISYYSHKNAQARANSDRDVGDSYFWDAVRRNNS